MFRLIFITFICLFYSVFFTEHAFAENTLNYRAATQPRTVKIGYFSLENFQQVDAIGIRKGYGYEYFQRLRLYCPWKFAYVDRASWADVYQMLKDGEIDMLSGVFKTPENENLFGFSKYPIGQSSSIITVKAGDNRFKPDSYQSWNGIRVGLVKSGTQNKKFELYAKAKNFTFKPVYYENCVELAADLQAGKNIDAIMTSDLRAIKNEWIIDQFNPEPFFIAVRKGDGELLAQLNTALENLNSPYFDFRTNLRKRYYSSNSPDEISFTKQESEFISSMRGKIFTAVLNPNNAPFSWCADGVCKGLFKDIFDEIARRSGLNIRQIHIDEVEEYLRLCKDPKTDLIFDTFLNLSAAEERDLVLTEPYFFVSVSKLSAVHPLTNSTDVAIVVNSGVANLIERHLLKLPENTDYAMFKTAQDAINAVLSGRCATAYLNTRTAEYAVVNSAGALRADYLPSVEIVYAIAVREDLNPILASILNKVVLSIDNEFINSLRTKYAPVAPIDNSFKATILRHPLLAFAIPSIIALLLSLFIVYYARSKRVLHRIGAVFSNMPIRYFVTDVDGNILQSHLGGDSGGFEAGLQNLREIPNPEVAKIMEQKTRDAILNGRSGAATYSFNKNRIRSAFISPLPESVFGKPTAIWISQDITALEKSREQALQNEEFCRLTLDSVGDGVITTDIEGKIILLNPVAERMIGVKLADVVGKPHDEVFKIVNSYDKTRIESPILRTLRTGTIVELANHTDLISLDGRRSYHIADSSAPILNKDGKVVGAILVFRDVTEEYQRRSEINAELAHWTAVSEMAQIYNFKFNTATRKIDGLDRLGDIWPIKNGIAEKSENWIYKDDLAAWKSFYSKIVEGKAQKATLQYRVLQGSKMRYFQVFMRRDDSEQNLITGVVQEITGVIRSHEKENAIQQMWKAFVDSVPAAMFIKRGLGDFSYLQCNDRFAEFFNKKPFEVIGSTDAILSKSAEAVARLQELDKKMLASKSALEFHESFERFDGQKRNLHCVNVRTKGVDGNPIIVGISFDETQDFNRRIELKNLLDNWEQASEMAGIVAYKINYKTWEISGTKRLSEFWRIENGKGSPAKDYVFKDDVEACEKAYKAVIEGTLPQAVVDYRVLKNDITVCLCAKIRLCPIT